MKPRLSDIANRLDNPEDYPPDERRSRRRAPSANQMERFKVRVRRTVADIDYYLAAPLGWREGTIVIWAGMRGGGHSGCSADSAGRHPRVDRS